MAAALASSISGIVSTALTVAFVFMIMSTICSFVQPLCTLALNLTLDPLSIPIYNQVLLWSQICALILVVFIRVGKGLYENVFQKAANEETGSAVQWAFKSIIAVICVAVMPLICTIIMKFGSEAFVNLTTVGKNIIGSDGINLGFQFPEDSYWENLAKQPMQTLGITFGSCIFVILEVVFIVMNTYAILKRHIVCYVVSLAATWVSIKSATDNTDDLIDVLVSLLGLVLIQVVQWLFFIIALVQMSKLKGGASLIGADLTDQQTIYTIIFMLAMMGTAIGVPQILERYAFSTGRSGAGNMIVGAAMRTGFAAPRSIGNTASRVLGGVGKAIARK